MTKSQKPCYRGFLIREMKVIPLVAFLFRYIFGLIYVTTLLPLVTPAFVYSNCKLLNNHLIENKKKTQIINLIIVTNSLIFAVNN